MLTYYVGSEPTQNDGGIQPNERTAYPLVKSLHNKHKRVKQPQRHHHGPKNHAEKHPKYKINRKLQSSGPRP